MSAVKGTMDGRRFHLTEPARMHLREDGLVEVLSPRVGEWVVPAAPGMWVRPGMVIGALEVLGQRIELIAPDGALGVVTETTSAIEPGLTPSSRGLARRPVAYGTPLLVLDPSVSSDAAAELNADSGSDEAGLVFRAPMGGRFYAKPAPDKPFFVNAGDEVGAGQTLCLLEVMKTFNRVQYGGDLPARCRIVRMLVENETDIDEGQALFELEAL